MMRFDPVDLLLPCPIRCQTRSSSHCCSGMMKLDSIQLVLYL